MSINKIIEPITRNFLENKNEHFLFFSVPEVLASSIGNYFPENIRTIDLDREFSPVKPFLGLIAENHPDDGFIDKFAYSLQRDTFKTYFRNGVASIRKDVVITDEIYYEKIRFRKTTQILAEKYIRGTYIILNAQKLCQSAINVLLDLEKSKRFQGKLIFIINNKAEEVSAAFQENYNQISIHPNFFELTQLADDDLNELNGKTGKYYPGFNEINDYLTNCIAFISENEGVNFIRWMERHQKHMNFSELQKKIINLESGVIFYYAGMKDEAIYYLNSVIESDITDDYAGTALYFLARVCADKLLPANGLKYAEILLQKLEKNRNSYTYALAKAVEFQLVYSINQENSIGKYYEAVDLLKKHNLENNYCSIFLTLPFKAIRENDKRSEILNCLDSVDEIYKRLDNQYGLSFAYNWRGILMLHNGSFQDSEKWYSECNRIRTQIGYLPAMVKIRNGISFQNLVRTNYSDAYDILNAVAPRITEMTDYSEIIITFWNMVQALFYGQNFKAAEELLQKIQTLMLLFKLDKQSSASFLPAYNDILLYLTYVEFRLGGINRAKIHLYNILHNKQQLTQVHEPIKVMLSAQFDVYDGNIEKARERFEKAIELVSEFSSTQLYKKVFMLYEFAMTLEKNDHYNESQFYLYKGFKLAKENNFRYYTKGKEIPNMLGYDKGIVLFKPVKVNLEDIEAKAEKDQLMIQMQRRLRDSQFLNKVMSFQTNSKKEHKYTSSVMQNIFEYTAANGVYLFEKKDKEWNMIASISKKGIYAPDRYVLEDMNKQSFEQESGNQLFYSDIYKFYYGNISKYDFEGCIIIIPDENCEIGVEERRVLDIAVTNVQSQLVMRNQNEHLLRISSTDQLSKLNNRRALQEKLSIQSEMVRRYQRTRSKNFQLSITFFDLDNFKYINDTFGHEAGDLIISKFAASLTKVYRRVDFIARFGGDEFVVLLPNTDCQEGRRAAERLREEMTEENFYLPDLRRLVGHEIYIPEEKKLSFSAGISSNYDLKDATDMETAMTYADRALYWSKNHGKGCMTLWQDIQDKYDE